jgi:C-terminal processing protease CtpA/Prc
MKLKKVFLVSLCMLVVFGQVYLYGTKNRTLDQTTRLAGLCKVWGLLKYFHQEVAKGEIDWDAVLINAVPAVKAAEDFDSFNQEIDNLIQEAGGIDKLDYNPQTNAYPNDELFKWIKDHSLFNPEISKKLKTIQKKHDPFNNYYVQYNPAGTAGFPNEKPYSEPHYPDENYRLLGLFRYWNIINFFFPYRNLTDMDWEDVLEKFIPLFMNVSDKCEYQNVILELAAHINDGHAISNIPYGVSCLEAPLYAPFESRYIESKTIVTRVFPNLMNSPEDFKVGDIILKRDGMDIDEYRQSRRKYTKGSNEPGIQRYINWDILLARTTPFTYTILRNGQVKDVSTPMYNYSLIQEERNAQDSLLEKWEILPGNIGYINMGLLYVPDVYPAVTDLMETRAIIFDLRFHANGTAYSFPYYLFPQATKVVKLTYPSLYYPGIFMDFDWALGPLENPDYYKGKVVILVNENTISHGEFSAMILQGAPGAVVVGNQTAGADGNVTYFSVPGGIRSYMSGLGVYYPDGSLAQREGVAVDIEVHPTIPGIQAGRDEELEKTIQFIENSK